MSKKEFKTFRTASIVALVSALLVGICMLFNPHTVTCNVYGYQFNEASLMLVILWSFLAGVVVCAVISALYLIKFGSKITALKKRLKEVSPHK